MHKLQWQEYYSSLFITEGPNQNIVQVERNFTDLTTKMEELLENPARAKQIAQRSAETFRDRYLTPAATACYMRELVRSYASIQAYEPQIWHEVTDEETGLNKTVLRGRPYETWMLEPLLIGENRRK
jgi:hypothetical protein